MKIANNHKLAVAIALALGTTAVHHSALAQEAASRGLEEVIVLAQKREQSLQEVPIAASAFTGAALEMRFAKDMTDLSGVAPNVSLELEGISNYSAAFYIRGQGVLNRGAFIDPAVAVVVDGVTDGRVSTSLADFLDVESIEILRGPQGTLQGRNATAGAVLVNHFKPI
ncbi:MAG: TonB-dependent receptor plug domain-containing protein [Spongiibacteraceae bacterium]